MGKLTDIKIKGVKVYFIEIKTRIPFKFGKEIMTSVCCARVNINVEDRNGRVANGWGETPLNVQWAWPSDIPFERRESIMKEFVKEIAKKLVIFDFWGHPVEISFNFQKEVLENFLKQYNKQFKKKERIPYLASLVCFSPFDIAIHDAYGNLHKIPIYETYNKNFMNYDLSHYLSPAKDTKISFSGKYIEDFLTKRKNELIAWHLVGGKDPIENSELTGKEPEDGYPVLLEDWIKKDGLKCIKIKLSGVDFEWDYNRIINVGKIALQNDVWYISVDFNCTVSHPEYVNEILEKIMKNYPRIYGMILYIEQPFPYDLEKNQIDVHLISSKKPIFMDESAHTWEFVKLGRKLGWNGVALKTCKTQTNALLTLCWAKSHGMSIMVQDLSNPMLAQIPHLLLASYAGTIMGVETNCMQFYPDVSEPEKKVHPYIYSRINGKVNLSTIKGYGFGYQIEKIGRVLPQPAIEI